MRRVSFPSGVMLVGEFCGLLVAPVLGGVSLGFPELVEVIVTCFKAMVPLPRRVEGGVAIDFRLKNGNGAPACGKDLK